MFKNWAQPVTNKRWAAVAVISHWISAFTNYRVLVNFKVRAWEKATTS